nr:MAG TPA: hypothetical protein [Caudoviricetes sp.]DAV09238.1 MAG TPA: hypothetical protein [Caudoviricetes sp.]
MARSNPRRRGRPIRLCRMRKPILRRRVPHLFR